MKKKILVLILLAMGIVSCIPMSPIIRISERVEPLNCNNQSSSVIFDATTISVFNDKDIFIGVVDIIDSPAWFSDGWFRNGVFNIELVDGESAKNKFIPTHALPEAGQLIYRFLCFANVSFLEATNACGIEFLRCRTIEWMN